MLINKNHKHYNLILKQNIKFNFSLSNLKHFHNFYKHINTSTKHIHNQHFFNSLHIKTPNQQTHTNNLSNNNQQKIIINKTLITKPTIIILNKPTHNININTKLKIYKLINHLTTKNKTIILISNKLPKLININNHIIILHKKKINNIFKHTKFTQKQLLTTTIKKSHTKITS